MTVYGGLFRGTAPEEKAAVLASYGEKKIKILGAYFILFHLRERARIRALLLESVPSPFFCARVRLQKCI